LNKFRSRTRHEGPEGDWVCNSSLSLTLALDEGGWSSPRPNCFTPPKRCGTRCTGVWVGRSCKVQKSSPPPGFYPLTV